MEAVCCASTFFRGSVYTMSTTGSSGCLRNGGRDELGGLGHHFAEMCCLRGLDGGQNITAQMYPSGVRCIPRPS